MPRFPKPPSPDFATASVEIENQKKITDFDEYLAELIVSRAISFRIHDKNKAEEAKREILPKIRENVDTALIVCICSNNPIENHNLPVPKYTTYKREDTVTWRVRRIVELMYPGAHKEFIRQKTTGCMITIQSTVNTAWLRLRA